MRRKIFLLGFLLSIMIMPSFAQIDDEIQQSKTEQVRKGREYLTEKFLDRDYEKVKEIKDCDLQDIEDLLLDLFKFILHHHHKALDVDLIGL